MAEQQLEIHKVVGELLTRAEESGDGDSRLLKRRCIRYASRDDYFVKLPAGDSHELCARGYNICADGLCVIVHQPLPVDAHVAVQSDTADAGDPWIPAVVMHCTQTVGGYKLGLRFEL